MSGMGMVGTTTGRTAVRVLVVDDEPAFARLTRDYLERELADDEVLVEHRALDALDRLEEADVDCVVSDYEMPGRTGIEFLEELRERRPDLPFVLFTGEGSKAVASDAISAGVTDYLQKGGTERFELLANRVETAVEKHRTGTELDRSEDRYRTLVELAPVPIVVHQEMEVVYANQRAVEFLGADDRSTILGRSPLEFVAPDYRETIVERVQSVLGTGEPAEVVELPMRDVDSERRLALITGARICYGSDPAVLTVARDVTERKQIEGRFRALIEHSPMMTRSSTGTERSGTRAPPTRTSSATM